ncbi:MAG: 2-hydroxyacyl-CoA dehydratase [Chloroflexi bacterium]|nr:2-hydroxyacyl-CoA dehydratase [Chloroflexota bacterium]
MENKLKELVQAVLPESRNKWALEWKKEKGNVVGVLTSHVPEEVIYASGMLPFGVSGSWEASTPFASIHRPSMSCRYCIHVLEAILNGELDFLNGLVSIPYDDDFKTLWYLIDYLGKPGRPYMGTFNHIMYLPHVNSETTFPMWLTSVHELKDHLQRAADRQISDDSLRKANETYNTTRTLLKKVYELRKREIPAITGAEVLGLVTASRVMPRDLFNRSLTELLPYLEDRKAPLKKAHPRVLVSSDFLDNPAYIDMIENTGCVVAMDDLDLGSRYIWNNIDTAIKDPWEAVARRYLDVTSPFMVNWKKYADQLIGWVREYRIDGVIDFRQLYSYPREYMSTYVVQRLKEAGIPYTFVRRDYHLSGVGMLTTRVEAFVEMLQGTLSNKRTSPH